MIKVIEMLPHYFKPLRRKIGVVTLVVACLFSAWWVRSLTVYDLMLFPQSENNSFMVMSAKSCIWLRWMEQRGLKHHLVLLHGEHYSATDITIGLDDHPIWVQKFCGYVLSFNSSLSAGWNSQYCLFPYWLLVLPQTLFSAWLLLTKPRAKKTALAE